MLNTYYKMCNHVSRDEKTLVEHISNKHGFGLYASELQKIISKQTVVYDQVSISMTLPTFCFLSLSFNMKKNGILNISA
jgi:hypothetical protein